MKIIILIVLTFSQLTFAQNKMSLLNEEVPPFQLPKLDYSNDALVPIIDQETMRIHHGLHHKSYIDNLNKAIGSDKSSLKLILQNVSKKPDSIRNNAGGHWNHSFFWTILTPNKKKQIMNEKLKTEIIATFGSVELFKAEFEKTGAAQFGSGWVWLIRDINKKLKITSTPNQDNPLMDISQNPGHPILGLDVWEHAYYLNYQNKRAAYIKNFWNIVNWEQVAAYDSEFIK